MERSEVYRLIDGEREYQDRRWGGEAHDAGHSPEDFRRFMERYVLLDHYGEREFTLDSVRKIAALAVACMEVHGAPSRAKPAPEREEGR